VAPVVPHQRVRKNNFFFADFLSKCIGGGQNSRPSLGSRFFLMHNFHTIGPNAMKQSTLLPRELSDCTRTWLGMHGPKDLNLTNKTIE